MALKLKCPCGEKLTAPESAAGKRGKCPKCGKSFVIPRPKAAAPVPTPQPPPADDQSSDDFGLDAPELAEPDSGLDDLLDDALSQPAPAAKLPDQNVAEKPRARSKESGDTVAKMRLLANGIKLVFWGTVLILGSIVSAILSPMISENLGTASTALALIGAALSTIGRAICLGAPSQAGGKGVLVAAVACDLVYMGITMVGVPGLPVLVTGIAAVFLWLATLILFILFLQAVAKSIHQDQLAEEARSLIIFVVMAMFLLVGIVIPVLGIFSLFGFLGVLFITTWRYVNLLQFTAETVRP